jgi:hypothetical protein
MKTISQCRNSAIGNRQSRIGKERPNPIAFFSESIVTLCLTAVLASFSATCSAADTFEQTIQPLLRDYCLSCHSTEKREGELDLQRFGSLDQVKQHADVWARVQEQLATGEMPPKDAKQLSADQKQQLIGWIRKTLNEIALATAGDPGPVVLRRLSNHEYTYTLRDLTGVNTLNPAREFPVDGAAGEGFTNSGAALVMSPALLSKYLDAAKEVSRHLVLLDDGIRFSPSDSPQDWSDEALAKLRQFYARYTVKTEEVNQVDGTGLVKNEGGAIPLARYLEALQGRGQRDDLSAKYLSLLEQALTAKEPSLVLDSLRAKFRAGQLKAADIEAWQKVLWRFNTVGHIGRPKGPKSWQELANPFAVQQEFRVTLEPSKNAKIFLSAATAGDGDTDDEVVWENPRIVTKGRPDIPLGSVPELLRHLETQREKLIADCEGCLAALAAGNENAPKESLAIWREYLGYGASSKLEPLLSTKVDGTPDYKFVKGWRHERERDLSVLANSSDADVRIPGILKAHSITTHPSPSREAVIAWKSPIKTSQLRISGHVEHAHPECGNGVTWALEVRRGNVVEKLTAGVQDRAKGTAIGPFENVRIEAEHAVVLSIGPRDGNHQCDNTAVQLTFSDGDKTWDLAKDVSPNILAANPIGPWNFLSQPVSPSAASELPAPILAWRKAPSPELAAKVREYLEKDFPLTHPLLASTWKSFRPSKPADPLKSHAPAVLHVDIPALLTNGGEFVVTGRLADKGKGSVQLHVSTLVSNSSLTDLFPAIPIVVGDSSTARKQFESAFDDFRRLFPKVLCYSRIVPIDEVVTLTLYHREDAHLQRLMLSEAEAAELDQLWRELLFVSEAPLKQVDVFEQLYQFATQDRAELAEELKPLREPTLQAAAEFRSRKQQADAAQRQAVLNFAALAWRRPLTEQETAQLRSMPPRLMLVRVLTSPAFLYRGETPGKKPGPVNDWEVATRLSYFLWSSMPDEELRSLAAAGKLSNPDVLAAQARRMLKDPKIRRLATEFGCQFLHVRDVATLDEKSERHFPSFTKVRDAMQEEVVRFYIDLLQNDRRVLSLLDADHTFLNKTLAEHYGIPFTGDDWQRVDGLRQQGRGGALGFSAVLAKHAGASRTSAILRGVWVSEVLLGDKIPNPPKGVPVLPDEAPAGLNERQLIERHSSDNKCASCHKRIDPYGFALEGFDAIGRQRAADTKTILFDGTAVEGLSGLRTYLVAQRKQDFTRQFSRKLLGYALGRSVQLSDQPLIDNLVATENGRIGDLIEQIVCSRQFREIRGDGSLE